MIQNQSKNQCPYLSTVKKHLLDFDFEKICSISLSSTNVYGCLVCGRFFRGRMESSPAYQHSIEYNHFVFIHLHNSKIYCLPDNYEIHSHTLDDIKQNLLPQYKEQQLQKFELAPQVQYNIDGKQFYPGVVGLNNLGQTDFSNCVFQLVNSIAQLRQLFLLREYKQIDEKDKSLCEVFSIFLKKIWNRKSFKGVVNPHQVMQFIAQKSNKVFKIGKSADPTKFLIWLFDNLSKELKKEKVKCLPIHLLQGVLKTAYVKGIKNSAQYEQIPTKVEEKNFLLLNLQFPERGIFNKVENEVTRESLLSVYEGHKGSKYEEGLRYIRVVQLPKYLLLCYKRFIKNEFKIEKDNSTVLYDEQLTFQTGEKYKLLSQICHQGSAQNGSYNCFVRRGEKWFCCYDLEVNEVLVKQMLLGQPYLQLYQKLQ